MANRRNTKYVDRVTFSISIPKSLMEVLDELAREKAKAKGLTVVEGKPYKPNRSEVMVELLERVKVTRDAVKAGRA